MFLQFALFISLGLPIMSVCHAGTVGQQISNLQEIARGMGGQQPPWEKGLSSFEKSLTGPAAKSAVVILICLTGLGIGFGIGGDMIQKGMKLLFGAGITFGGAQWLLPIFGVGAGAIL